MSNSDLKLLPRADLPVIWDAFKAKADEVRQIAETLVVSDISQKEEMALARKTRLTLREIRIAVEHKRVELGEGHLKEIQKVNGAAKAIREFIEPLEARLLVQESFAERAEAARIVELSKSRFVEVTAISPRFVSADLGRMSQFDYDGYVASLRAEVAEIKAANRLRVEAERRLVVAQAENEAKLIAIGEEAARQESARKAEMEIELRKLRVKQAEERRAAEALAQEREEFRRQEQARLDAERAVRDADMAEQKRIRDEQLAKLEAELKAERAVKLAEAEAARKLALAPDLEKLREFKDRLRFVAGPELESEAAKTVCWEAISLVLKAALLLDTFYKENLTVE